jgi:hypothetical protein
MRWAIWTVGLILGAAGAQAASGNHAIRVIDYEPGSDPGAYTDATAALGSPSRQTDDPHPQWGGIWPVDPFSAPYLPYQIVEIGSGGRLTLAFEHPVLNDPTHPYGIDLLVFGNAFFQLNPDWTTANGQLGGANEGLTVVSVSADGQRFFRLDPERSALIDSWHPTDGQGDFARPVNPVLGPADFAGLDLEGIRRLYDGSGGGTGLKLDHAVDEHGEPVVLPWIRFIRFEQASGRAQVDAVSGVAPRPTLFNDFNHPPTAANWRVAGDASLFQWNNTAGTLRVTWDSSRPNSYFYQPLGTVLSRTDDFVLGFDLRLDSIQPGTTPGKPYAFQIAVGLVDLQSVLDPAFRPRHRHRTVERARVRLFPRCRFRRHGLAGHPFARPISTPRGSSSRWSCRRNGVGAGGHAVHRRRTPPCAPNSLRMTKSVSCRFKDVVLGTRVHRFPVRYRRGLFLQRRRPGRRLGRIGLRARRRGPSPGGLAPSARDRGPRRVEPGRHLVGRSSSAQPGWDYTLERMPPRSGNGRRGRPVDRHRPQAARPCRTRRAQSGARRSTAVRASQTVTTGQPNYYLRSTHESLPERLRPPGPVGTGFVPSVPGGFMVPRRFVKPEQRSPWSRRWWSWP